MVDEDLQGARISTDEIKRKAIVTSISAYRTP